jgi:hypothetical protein
MDVGMDVGVALVAELSWTTEASSTASKMNCSIVDIEG